MSKRAKLPISKNPNGQWRYDLPPSMSGTGKRQRKFFEAKKAAELARDQDLERHRLYGIEGHSLSATLAADAARAYELLHHTGASLTEAAKAYIERVEEQSRSRTFAEVWQARHEAATGLSADHNRTLTKLGNKLLPQLGDTLICDISHDQLRSALSDHFPTAHGFNLALRTISPAFTLAVDEGWAIENPCKRIKPLETGRNEISVLSLNQCRKLMVSCRDFRRDKAMPANLRVDASGALPALSLMLFAGIRPGGEIGRLDWDDIDMDEGTVHVSNQKAKTDRSRYFHMPETLHLWLQATPPTDRVGAVIPSNWKRCWQAIRKHAGIADKQDTLRKTFASMHLAHFKDVNLTREIMGHEHGEVLFRHYRGLVRPKDAGFFWEISPSRGKAISLAKSA